jgi:hypothetical protein
LFKYVGTARCSERVYKRALSPHASPSVLVDVRFAQGAVWVALCVGPPPPAAPLLDGVRVGAAGHRRLGHHRQPRATRAVPHLPPRAPPPTPLPHTLARAFFCPWLCSPSSSSCRIVKCRVGLSLTIAHMSCLPLHFLALNGSCCELETMCCVVLGCDLIRYHGTSHGLRNSFSFIRLSFWKGKTVE